jgi:hypothetical protein
VEYADFELEVTAASGGGYVLAVKSPAGEAQGEMKFPYDRLELTNKIQSLQIALLRSGGGTRAATAEDVAVKELGRDLFHALLPDQVANNFRVSRAIASQQGLGVRIKLRISAPELVALPWEYLFDEERDSYLALSDRTPVVRYVPVPVEIRPLKVSPPIRILGMTAGPRDLPELNTARERQRLELALKSLIDRGVVEFQWVGGERWEDLQEALWRPAWHIFHFIGHGGFNATRGTGVIYLSTEKGFARELSAADVGLLLGDHEPLRLAVLNSCETAEGDRTDVFSSTAATLVRRGTPAVVAMQFQITDDAAIQFSRAFYAAIAYGMPIDAAVSAARKAVALGVSNSYEWGTPVLFMRSQDGVLFNVPSARDPQKAVAQAAAEPIPTTSPTTEPQLNAGAAQAEPAVEPIPSTDSTTQPQSVPDAAPVDQGSTEVEPVDNPLVRAVDSTALSGSHEATPPIKVQNQGNRLAHAKSRRIALLGAIGAAGVLALIGAIFVLGGRGPGPTATAASPTIIASPTGSTTIAPVPTLSTAFLENHDWSMTAVTFEWPTLPLLTPEEVLAGGGEISFEDNSFGSFASWTFATFGASVDCDGRLLAGDLIEGHGMNYTGGNDGPADTVGTVLCGMAQPPFSLTLRTLRPDIINPSWALTMANPNGTTFVWNASSRFVIPTPTP